MPMANVAAAVIWKMFILPVCLEISVEIDNAVKYVTTFSSLFLHFTTFCDGLTFYPFLDFFTFLVIDSVGIKHLNLIIAAGAPAPAAWVDCISTCGAAWCLVVQSLQLVQFVQLVQLRSWCPAFQSTPLQVHTLLTFPSLKINPGAKPLPPSQKMT